MSNSERILLADITDDGRDVDDVLAKAYLAGREEVETVAVVPSHMIPDRRAMIMRPVYDSLGKRDVPIGVGSVYPIGKEDPMLVDYLRSHTIRGQTYEGEGMIECFPDGVQLLCETFDQYGSELVISVGAPLTDLAKAAVENPDGFAGVGGLYIQGQAYPDPDYTGRLLPDPSAYNLQEDMEAASIVMGFQDTVPMTFVGKYAAYQVPFTRDDFARFADIGHPVGTYLKTHAEMGIACFAERAPDVFERVYGLPADQVEQLEVLSNPYDAVVAKVLADPDGMTGRQVGHHMLYGMTAEDHGVDDPVALKAELVGTIMRALDSTRL